MFGKPHNPAQLYAQVHVSTGVSQADPHHLIVMLFEGADNLMVAADGAIQNGDLAAKGEAISRTIRIIDEGLRAVLEPQAGELADNLRSLYGYMLTRLLQANLRNDRVALGEVRSLLNEVAAGWSAIAPGARSKSSTKAVRNAS